MLKYKNQFTQNYYKNKRKILLFQLLIIINFLLLWEILSHYDVINTFMFSSPTLIIKKFFHIAQNSNILSHILTTVKEVFISFLLGFIISMIISIILYENKLLGSIFDPFLTILNSLPKVALGPMIIILSGANQKSIIIMSLLINVIVSIITIYNGFINTDKVKIKLFKTFNASKKDILTKLIIPINFPTIISSLKLNISLSLIGVITGEFLVSKQGIGYLIIYGTQIFDMDLVYLGIIILLIISFLLYKSVLLLETIYFKKYKF